MIFVTLLEAKDVPETLTCRKQISQESTVWGSSRFKWVDTVLATKANPFSKKIWMLGPLID